MAYGTVNADVIGTSVAGSNLGAGNASIMKNRIINGAMVIDQRNAGAATANTINDYTLDRWAVYQSVTGKVIAQQNAGSVTPPVGFSNYLGITSQSAYSVLSSDYYNITQSIEGFNTADLNWGTANAKTITISFWVRSSLTGTFGGTVQNSDNSRSYPFSYTISASNTWTQISVTISGDTSGTWIGATNGIGIKIRFSLGAGATYSGTANTWASATYSQPTGATSVVGTNGATFYITGVQLEVGSSATGFEYRQYGQELALCQRYYQVAQQPNAQFSAFANDSVNAYGISPFMVTMRANPTMGYTGSASGFNIDWSGTGGTGSTVTFFNTTTQSSGVHLALTSGILTTNAAVCIVLSGSNTITASAEL